MSHITRTRYLANRVPGHPRSRAISRIVFPLLAKCSRRIRATVSTTSILASNQSGKPATATPHTPQGRIVSPGMLLNKFSPITGTASPNRIGVADGEKNQHGRAARGGVGGGATLRVGQAAETGRVLDELCATTGWHRKHAVRALRQRKAAAMDDNGGPRERCGRDGIVATIQTPLAQSRIRFKPIWDRYQRVDRTTNRS
jgi:hypothetical protein